MPSPIRLPVDSYPAIAFGIDLPLTSTAEGGRSGPLLNVSDPFSRDVVLPGESVHAVIVTLFPEMVAQWDREVTPGVSLPMYEGARVCGHGTVIWRADILKPLA